jgi:hypothetical protein
VKLRWSILVWTRIICRGAQQIMFLYSREKYLCDRRSALIVGGETTDVELASYSGRCVNCRSIPTSPEYYSHEEVTRIPTDLPVMRQLVGQNCVHCQYVIDSIYEGQFCGACGNPIHNKCLGSSTIFIAPSDRCRVCGGDLESSIAQEERAKNEAVNRNIEKEAVKAQLAAEHSKEVRASAYRAARLLFFLIIGLGVKIIFPKLYQEGRFFVDDSGLGPGLGAIFAGIGMIVLSYVLQWKRK